MPRTVQSIHMAAARPSTPQGRTTLNSRDRASRNTMVVRMEIAVVKRTSPAALSPFPRESANGKANVLKVLWMKTSVITSDFVSCATG